MDENPYKSPTAPQLPVVPQSTTGRIALAALCEKLAVAFVVMQVLSIAIVLLWIAWESILKPQ